MVARRTLWLKIITYVAGTIPLVLLAWAYWQDKLGPDRIGEATRRAGRYGLVFLLLSLTPTVLARVTGYRDLLRVRRTLGLYAFMYHAVHFFIYVGIDFQFDYRLIWLDVRQGRFVLVGLAGLILMIPLALTSTDWWIKRLGKRWKHLHRLAYAVGALAVIHYAWKFKELRFAPLVAGAVLAVLLILRLPPVARTLSRRGNA